jgi:hypothetical protein
MSLQETLTEVKQFAGEHGLILSALLPFPEPFTYVGKYFLAAWMEPPLERDEDSVIVIGESCGHSCRNPGGPCWNPVTTATVPRYCGWRPTLQFRNRTPNLLQVDRSRT